MMDTGQCKHTFSRESSVHINRRQSGVLWADYTELVKRFFESEHSITEAFWEKDYGDGHQALGVTTATGSQGH